VRDMAKKVAAKSCQIVIRLGDTPQFQIAADEDETANPQDMTYRNKGVDKQQLSLLRELVATMLDAYPDSESASICCEGKKIVQQAKCAT
jgi:hypothetical protein